MIVPHPDLAALLRGETGHVEAAAAVAHLESCTTCHETLPSTVLGHALLTRAARTRAEGSLVPVAERAAAAAVVRPHLGPPDTRAEPPAPPDRREPGRRLRRLRRLGLAAAVAAVAVTAVSVLGPGPGDDPSGAPDSLSADLLPVADVGSGQVEMTDRPSDVTAMVVSTTDLPETGPGAYYYVWLLDPTTEKMLPLGQVSPDGSASFDLPHDLVDRYSVVDVSLERDDGDPGHSVTSVLRAAYGEAPVP